MSPATTILAGAIKLYRRYISPFTAQRCRFEPTCSAYALEAISERGAVVGTALALRRVARCHPWSPGGFDRVPAKRAS
jgi:putative membrane protein insertion efficiency factor